MQTTNTILIYTQKTSARLRYIFKYILIDIIGFNNVVFSTDFNEFEKSVLPKINYSSLKKNCTIWIVPHTILFETGLKDYEMKSADWQSTKAFFMNNKTASLPFDLFAASFYLVSRYEEYLPTILDSHERFEAHESIAYKQGFLQQPVVDIWAKILKKIILESYPELHLHQRKYAYLNTIDIDNAWAYKHKGIFRTIGAFARDLWQLNTTNFIERVKVLFHAKKDMYDTYDYMFHMQEKYNLKTIYFFLFAEYGVNDKNISVENKQFRKLIKSIADEGEVGIHPSYNSNYDEDKLENEIKNLGKVIKRDITKSRQHFLKLSFPKTYQTLLELDITDDYTMGYASEIGFRAGTTIPFLFYNIDLEIETKLRIHPFQVMDATLLYYMKLTPEEASQKIKKLIDEIKAVNGIFTSLWHNETLSDRQQWAGWQLVYDKMIADAV